MPRAIRIHDMVADEIGRLLAEDGIELAEDELVALAEFLKELEDTENVCAAVELLRPQRKAA